MKKSKESLQVKESSDERKSDKFPAKASGAKLEEGLAMKASAGDVDGMYQRDDEGKQRAEKGSDRI